MTRHITNGLQIFSHFLALSENILRCNESIAYFDFSESF